MSQHFMDYAAVAMTGTVAIRRAFRNRSGGDLKLYSITIKINTAMADPRIAYATIRPAPDDAGKVIATGFASGFNDFERRFSPPIKIPHNMVLCLYGYGDTGTEIGFQYEADQPGLADLGVTQY